MSQKRDTLCSKTSFIQVQFQVHFSKFEKDSIQVLKMFFPIFAVYIEIGNKYLQDFVSQLFKKLLTLSW